MMRRVLMVGVVLLFLFTVSRSQGKTIIVDDDGGRWADYTLVNSSEDDIVRIYDGIYSELIIINQSVTLVGNGTNTIWRGNGSNTLISIHVNGSNSSISGINVTNANTGIYISALNVTVSDIIFSENSAAITVYNYGWITVNNCTITNNNIIGVHLINHTYSVISGCRFLSGKMGIVIHDCGEIRIENNTIESSSDYGIWIYRSWNNTVIRNNLLNNYCGIRIDMSSYNQILYNNITGSKDYGVIIDAIRYPGYPKSQGNYVYWNNITDNGFGDSQAYDSQINTWHNEMKGNRWSDYQGCDLDGDGVGESPYYINGCGNATDRYPLTDNVGILEVSIGVSANPTIEGSLLTIFVKINQSFRWEDGNITLYYGDVKMDNVTMVLNGTVILQFELETEYDGEFNLRVVVESGLTIERQITISVINRRTNGSTDIPNIGYVLLAVTTVLLATYRRRTF